MWHRFKNIIIFVLLLLVAAGITASLILLNENNQANTRQQQLTTQLQACLAGEEVPIDAPTCKYPTDKSCFHRSDNGWIVVNLPCDDQVVGTTLKVSGVAFGAFENTINYDLVNATGQAIQLGYIQVNAPDLGVPGLFDATLTFDGEILNANKGEASLKIYMRSANDGSIQNEVSIPVKI